MTEGELKKQVFEKSRPKFMLEHIVPCPHDTIDECDCAIQWIYKIIDSAKKDIMNGIENHLEKLANHWKKEQVGTEGLEKLKQKCYVDAYLSVLHNHREHDAFKIKKWFGDST